MLLSRVCKKRIDAVCDGRRAIQLKQHLGGHCLSACLPSNIVKPSRDGQLTSSGEEGIREPLRHDNRRIYTISIEAEKEEGIVQGAFLLVSWLNLSLQTREI